MTDLSTKMCVLLASTAALVAVPAQAREGQFYVGLDAGLSVGSDATADVAVVDPPAPGVAATTSNGYDIDAVAGYDFGAFRLEAEVSYKRNDYDSITIRNPLLIPGVPAGTMVTSDDFISTKSAMVNALVEFGDDDGFQGFAGVGIGVAEIDGPISVTGVGLLVDESSTDFAYQILVGGRYAISENIDIGLHYKYLRAEEFEIDTVQGTPFVFDYRTHSVLAGVRYNFGG